MIRNDPKTCPKAPRRTQNETGLLGRQNITGEGIVIVFVVIVEQVFNRTDWFITVLLKRLLAKVL